MKFIAGFVQVCRHLEIFPWMLKMFPCESIFPQDEYFPEREKVHKTGIYSQMRIYSPNWEIFPQWGIFSSERENFRLWGEWGEYFPLWDNNGEYFPSVYPGPSTSWGNLFETLPVSADKSIHLWGSPKVFTWEFGENIPPEIFEESFVEKYFPRNVCRGRFSLFSK